MSLSDNFNLNDFRTTKVSLIFSMIAYNLMFIFRLFILQEKTQKTLHLTPSDFCS